MTQAHPLYTLLSDICTKGGYAGGTQDEAFSKAREMRARFSFQIPMGFTFFSRIFSRVTVLAYLIFLFQLYELCRKKRWLRM